MGGANYQVRYRNSVSTTNGSQYLPEVQEDRKKVLQSGFNPEGIDYDYATAESAGMLPDLRQGENFMHMGSVTQTPPEVYDKYKQYGLPQGETYMALKGSKHDSFGHLLRSEADRGFEVKKFGDRYFSVPKPKKINY